MCHRHPEYPTTFTREYGQFFEDGCFSGSSSAVTWMNMMTVRKLRCENENYGKWRGDDHHQFFVPFLPPILVGENEMGKGLVGRKPGGSSLRAECQHNLRRIATAAVARVSSKFSRRKGSKMTFCTCLEYELLLHSRGRNRKKLKFSFPIFLSFLTCIRSGQ